MKKIKKILPILIICVATAGDVQANIFVKAWRWFQEKVYEWRGVRRKEKVVKTLQEELQQEKEPQETSTTETTETTESKEQEIVPFPPPIKYYPVEIPKEPAPEPEPAEPEVKEEVTEDDGPPYETEELIPEKITPQPKQPKDAFEYKMQRIVNSSAFAVKINEIIEKYYVVPLRQKYFGKHDILMENENFETEANNIAARIKDNINKLTTRVEQRPENKNITDENREFLKNQITNAFASGLKRAEYTILEEKEGIEEGGDLPPSGKAMVDLLEAMMQVFAKAHDYLLTP